MLIYEYMWSAAYVIHEIEHDCTCLINFLLKIFIEFLTQLDKTQTPYKIFQNWIWRDFPAEFAVTWNHSPAEPMVLPWIHHSLLWLCMCFSRCLGHLLENSPLDRHLHTFQVTPVMSPAWILWCLLTKCVTSSDVLHLRLLLWYHVISLLFYVVTPHYYNVNYYLFFPSLLYESSQHGNCLLLIFVSLSPSTGPH